MELAPCLSNRRVRSTENRGRLLELPHSFRVSPKIALFTNVLFSKLLENHEEMFNEVPYNNLVSVRNDTESANIEFIFNDEDDSDVSEAELAARRILKLIEEDKSVDFKDIAILTRKRNSFVKLERAFDKYNIPFTLIGGKGFYQKQAIGDIHKDNVHILSFRGLWNVVRIGFPGYWKRIQFPYGHVDEDNPSMDFVQLLVRDGP